MQKAENAPQKYKFKTENGKKKGEKRAKEPRFAETADKRAPRSQKTENELKIAEKGN